MPDSASHCPDCHLPLPAGGEAFGCPHCLLLLAADDSSSGDEGSKPKPPPAGLRSRFFGDYEIVEEIARGGMGIVFRARDLKLKRAVALKMIQPGHLASAEARMRFNLEVSAVAGLSHPHIVPLFDSGECDGAHFYTMALIEGGNLAAHIRSRPAPASRGALQRVAALLAQTARAVHYAHQHGIIHRDLKPANILLDRSGQPHISDFGLARAVEGDSGITYSNTVLGSPNYMAPEQARRHRAGITTAVDVYGLGAILFEALTGKPPFQAPTPLATMRKVLDEEPVSPRRLNPSVDADLDTICLKCLQKNPVNRYASAEELAGDLERWQSGQTIRARPVGALTGVWRLSRRHPAIAGLTLALVLALIAIAVGSSLSLKRITRAEAIAVGHLRESLLNQARTLRLAGRMGGRTESLKLIKSAASLGGDDGFQSRLRDEAIATLALSDVMFSPLRAVSLRPATPALLDPLLVQVSSLEKQQLVTRVIRTGEERFRMTLPAGHTHRLESFSPNARFLAVQADSDRSFWDVLHGHQLALTHQADRPFAFASHADLVLLQREDLGLDYRRLPGGELFREYEITRGAAGSVQRPFAILLVLPDGTRFVGARKDEPVVEMISSSDGRVMWTTDLRQGVTALAVDVQRQRVLAATADGGVQFLNWFTGMLVDSIKLPSPATLLASGNDSNLTAAMTTAGVLHLWEESSVRQLLSEPCTSPRLAFSPAGMRLGTVLQGGRIGWFELARSGEFAEYLVGSATNEITHCLLDDERGLIAAAGANHITLLNLTNGQSMAEMKVSGLNTLSLHPDKGAWLFADERGRWTWQPFPATNRYRFNLRVELGWDVPPGENLRAVAATAAESSPSATTADGRLFAQAVDPFTIELRNRQGRTLGRLTSPVAAPIGQLVFQREGTHLVAVVPGRLRVWDLRAMGLRLEELGLDWDVH